MRWLPMLAAMAHTVRCSKISHRDKSCFTHSFTIFTADASASVHRAEMLKLHVSSVAASTHTRAPII